MWSQRSVDNLLSKREPQDSRSLMPLKGCGRA